MKKISSILKRFDKEFSVLEIKANGVKRAINLSFIQKNLIKQFISFEIKELLEEQKDKIYKDLIAIADKGELEDMRREIFSYFEEAKK